MTRIFLACIFAIMAAPALAGSADKLDDAMQDFHDWQCGSEAEFATSVMMFRQLGGPMAEALGDDLADRHRAIVMEAYEAPREETKAAQLRAAEEFGNQAALACHERVSGGQEE